MKENTPPATPNTRHLEYSGLAFETTGSDCRLGRREHNQKAECFLKQIWAKILHKSANFMSVELFFCFFFLGGGGVKGAKPHSVCARVPGTQVISPDFWSPNPRTGVRGFIYIYIYVIHIYIYMVPPLQYPGVVASCIKTIDIYSVF